MTLFTINDINDIIISLTFIHATIILDLKPILSYKNVKENVIVGK